MADDHDAHMDDRIARLEAMSERAKSLPSWPTMTARLEQLTQAIETLQGRVDALEQECDALRQRELTRLWESTSPPHNGREA